MKRNRLQIWHRCGTCGTIFADLQELRSHLEKHTASKHWPPRLDPQYQTDSTDIQMRNRKVEPEQKIVRVDR